MLSVEALEHFKKICSHKGTRNVNPRTKTKHFKDAGQNFHAVVAEDGTSFALRRPPRLPPPDGRNAFRVPLRDCRATGWSPNVPSHQPSAAPQRRGPRYGSGEKLIHERAMLCEKTIDLRVPVAQSPDENDPVRTRSHPKISGQGPFQGSEVASFLFQVPQRCSKLVPGFGCQGSAKFQDLR